MTTNHTRTGWCKAETHPRFDHAERAECVDFVSDEEHTAELMARAAEHDAHNAGRIEAAYVAQHRPY